MAVANIINTDNNLRQFSFEVLPPLKGTGTSRLFADIEKLCELNPAFINITTHHSEYIYKDVTVHTQNNSTVQHPQLIGPSEMQKNVLFSR
jgi:5,10-methylenetetrahydrofolate reductase